MYFIEILKSFEVLSHAQKIEVKKKNV